MITFKTHKELEGYFSKDEQGWCGYFIVGGNGTATLLISGDR
jgi:hypothetical protein